MALASAIKRGHCAHGPLGHQWRRQATVTMVSSEDIEILEHAGPDPGVPPPRRASGCRRSLSSTGTCEAGGPVWGRGAEDLGFPACTCLAEYRQEENPELRL